MRVSILLPIKKAKPSQAYLDKRIIGLVWHVHLTNVSSYQSKITYSYDDPARLQSVPATAVQHDTAYSTSLTARGNITSVSRWDVTDINNASKALTSYTNYYTTGSPVSSTDPSGHQSGIAYADSFSDSINRNTFAYPTTITDADGFSSYVQYNFDFGATTRTQSPTPAGQTQGAIQTMTFNNLGQLQKITTTNNEAYKRLWYGPDYTASYATVNNATDESYSIEVTDGLGRVIGAVSNHPGSTGGYRLVVTVYDLMGRVWKQSNPTEVNNSWVPVGDDAAGIYSTQQTYDWQGRPLVTTNPDTTTREASYAGCGCAGGQVVTLTDEGTIEAGVAKRRQTKIYSDVLGRAVKTEILNWQGGSVYSATVNTYNARDQVTQVREYAGAEGSGTYQDTTMTYDGYGRLKTKHVPEQNAGTSTTWDYNADNMIQSVTDARGATATYGYNARHLVTSINYSAPQGITATAPVTFGYDAAGNRTSMTDGLGSASYNYDQLSRISSETRNFTGFGNFTLGYQYNLDGDLSRITDPFNGAINYTRDSAGRVTSITGTPFGGITSYTSNIKYRAWDTIKQLTYGDSRVLNASFDSRLRVSAFSVTGKISKAYDYYADGQLRFSSDLLDHRFDRFYSFDHVTRLKQAFSGAEARGEPATTNRPYKQTYAYDSFNHLTARTNEIWWTSSNSISDTYVNNRHLPQGNQWTYDADGRLLNGAQGINTYDAAGQAIHVEVPSFNTSHASFGLDGDGQQVKTEETTWNEDLQTDVTETKYYLRSSVLGGQVLTEFWGGVSYTRTFVYSSSTILAWQWRSYGFEVVDWEHKDPSGASVRFGGSGQELDPLGADAGTDAQTIIPDEGALTGYGSSYSPANPNTTYTVDGMAVSLDTLIRRGGYLLQDRFALLEDAARSSVPTLLNYGVLSNHGRRLRHFGLDADRAINEALEEEGLLIRSWLVDDRWFTTFLALSHLAQSPQNPSTETAKVPLVNLKKLLKDTLAYGDCADFLARLLAKAGELSNGKNDPISTDMMQIYSLLNRQGRGGIELNHVGPYYNYWGKGYEQLPPVAGGGGLASGYWQQQNRKAFINQIEIPVRTTALNVARVPYEYAHRILHEFFHVAGSNELYSHDIMDASARALGSRDADAAIRQHCIPREMW